MKNRYWLIILVLFLMVSAGCRTFPPELLRADKNESNGKLLPLEIGRVETEKVASENVRTVAVQSYLYTIFQRELENNIFATGRDNYGSIDLSIIYIDQRLGFWSWTTGLTLGLLPILGFPVYSTKDVLEIEMRIYDRDGNNIETYNYFRDETKNWHYYTPGGFYFWEYKAMKEHIILLFKDMMREFRTDIAKDSKKLNKTLQQFYNKNKQS